MIGFSGTPIREVSKERPNFEILSTYIISDTTVSLSIASTSVCRESSAVSKNVNRKGTSRRRLRADVTVLQACFAFETKLGWEVCSLPRLVCGLYFSNSSFRHTDLLPYIEQWMDIIYDAINTAVRHSVCFIWEMKNTECQTVVSLV
jgi:hypothetical protein